MFMVSAYAEYLFQNSYIYLIITVAGSHTATVAIMKKDVIFTYLIYFIPTLQLLFFSI